MSAEARSGELVAALRLRAEREPEQPAVFFRGRRGHFTWWSWARLAAELQALSEAERSSIEGVEAVPRGLVEVVLDPALEAFVPVARAVLDRLGAGPERDVWLCCRSLELSDERLLVAAALLGGWAIVREPVSPLPESTFAWARPTLLSGAPDEIVSLLDRFEALAPRWGRRRWLRRRLNRLRAVIVAGAESVEPLRTRLDRLACRARLHSLSDPSMELRAVVQTPPEGVQR